MLKLDLHIHSHYSEDAVGSPSDIIKSLKKKGLNGMCITDHNTVEGGLNALKIHTKDFIVIPGAEISTLDGHVLGLNLVKNIPKNLPLLDTIEIIIDEGGVPIIPHIYRNMSGVKKKKLDLVIDKLNVIEVFNSCSQPKTNLRMAKIANEYKLGGTGGSDTHDPKYAGFGYTTFQISDMNADNVIDELIHKRSWGEGVCLPMDYRKDRMIKSVKQFFQRGFKRI